MTNITNKEYNGEQKDGGNEEGAGSASRTLAAPALSFSGNAKVDTSHVSDSSTETPSQSDSTMHVIPAVAASGSGRIDVAADPKQSEPVASPILTSVTEAYDIFHKEYFDARGTAYVGNRRKDVKSLKHILISGTVTLDQFRYTIRGMVSDDYAISRGASVQVLANDWGEWQTKGKYIVKYPSGQQVVVPHIQDLGSRQASPSDSVFNNDIPTEHLKSNWDHLQEHVRDTVLNTISRPDARSVLLHGQPGTGKSTTAAAIVIGMRDQAERENIEPHLIRHIARFVSQAEFTRHALNTTFLSKDEGNFGEASGNGATEGSKYINSIMRFNGILILDDVVHKRADGRLAPLVIEIINYRHNNNLATIITSNLSPDQIAQKLDPAVASRLCGGTVLHFTGEDMRQHPKKEEVRNIA
ncbi:MAG: AAA family ATPase [Planctomycetes bacterium]|nr:AAA family ATPase [Planctomycetota bacterium]